MPAAAGERCADAHIFAFARNTVHARRHLQVIGIQSYHRRRRQLTYKCPQLNARQRSRPSQTLSISLQRRSRTRRHAFADVSALSMVRNASANAHICPAMCIRTFWLHCCAYNCFLSLANGGGKCRASNCHASTQNLKWTSAAVETRRLSIVHINQKLQRPTNERVQLLADLHAKLRSLFVTSRKLAG